MQVQQKDDPNGIDVRVEPKFTIPDGNPYTGGWCRPQTDGPALRAMALSKSDLWMILSLKVECELKIDLFILQVGNADGWEEQESRGIGRGFDKFETEKYWRSLAL